MSIQKNITIQRQRRSFRVRNRLRRDAAGRPRLSVFRSNRHIHAQIIDDVTGRTICSASSVEKELAGSGGYGGNRDFAIRVGKLLAERALGQGVKAVVFDRGRYKYHGRVAALAEAAREGGLDY